MSLKFLKEFDFLWGTVPRDYCRSGLLHVPSNSKIMGRGKTRFYTSDPPKTLPFFGGRVVTVDQQFFMMYTWGIYFFSKNQADGFNQDVISRSVCAICPWSSRHAATCWSNCFQSFGLSSLGELLHGVQCWKMIYFYMGWNVFSCVYVVDMFIYFMFLYWFNKFLNIYPQIL